MKTTFKSVRGIALVFCLVTANAVAGYFFQTVSSNSTQTAAGTIPGVTAGAIVEWSVYEYLWGNASVQVGGGGLNIHQSNPGDGYAVTTVTDTLSYYMYANGSWPDSSSALLSVGW